MQYNNKNCRFSANADYDNMCVELNVPVNGSQVHEKSINNTAIEQYSQGKRLKTEALSMLLLKMRVTPNHSGFKYLLSSIEFSLSCGDQHLCITKDIYPHVAKKCNSTPDRVERCMRKSIDYAWKNNGSEFFETVAGFKMSKKPTNFQFISFATEYIKSLRNEFYE
ncbi:stage 0 sporulation protein A [Clostridiales bacterium]|nr:stage 0 sporulation protein A [Clostridiales bacterium]